MYATDTDLAPEESEREEKYASFFEVFTLPLPPSPKESKRGMEGGLSLKEIYFMKKEKTGVKPVFLPFATFVYRKQ